MDTNTNDWYSALPNDINFELLLQVVGSFYRISGYKINNSYGYMRLESYTIHNKIKERKLDNGVWTTWESYLSTSNIQSGTGSFDSIAGQTVSVPVTFPIAFSTSPSVIITPITSTPHKWSVAANIITPTGFEAAVYHENSYNGLAFCWIAVGQ